jgi:hypothetical protein
MPRIRKSPDEPRATRPELVAQLAEELRNAHAGGQPRIEETVFPRTNALRVNVFWDRWEDVPDVERTNCILQAYREVEPSDVVARIALAGGLTFPEARASGMLPYEILPVLRRGDPITLEQCHKAMIQEGATVLESPQTPRLYFATEEEAEAGRQRLVKSLPESAEVWLIAREATAGQY